MLTKFEKQVLDRLKKIPRGKVTTYGELARAVKKPRAARAVGNALHKNPWAPRVPCHRVVKSDGLLGGYGDGIRKKIKLLKKEGIKITARRKIRNFRKIVYRF